MIKMNLIFSQLMHRIKDIHKFSSLSSIFRRHVSNISEKTFRYSFQVGSIRKLHPMRTLSDGTDRVLITPNLIALTDNGSGMVNKKYSENLDGTYAQKLLKVINSFFYNQIEKYIDNPLDLVASAVNVMKLEGNCTLTLAMTHPTTGEVVFYYIGNSIYGIFQEKQVIMVEGSYEDFNQPFMLGINAPSDGYVERYAYRDIKNDVILVGSNGLWDNAGLDLLHHEIRGPNSYESIGKKQQKEKGEPKSLQSIAERVGNIAAYYSKKGHYESPYYLRAKKAGVDAPKEGVLDDVAVILAKIRRETVIA